MTTLRDLFDRKAPALGSGVLEIATPGIGQILKAAGCDFAFVDMEHSGFDIGTIKQVLRYMQAADLPAMVRPPSQAYHHIARCLDVGAEGLILPMVETAEQTREIVACMKYPPRGRCGVGLGVAHDRYTAGSPAPKLRAANRNTVCILLIESRAAVENIEAIAAVPGVDALWVGHFDLSCDLGKPGDFATPDFKKAVARVLAAAKARGIRCGRTTADIRTGRALLKAGYDMICYGMDVELLRRTVAEGMVGLRKGGRRA